MKTRKKFLSQRKEDAKELVARCCDISANSLLERADRSNWIHMQSWMGEPCLQTPQDMIVIQEIIWKSKPSVIIECGIGWGGGLLMYRMLQNGYNPDGMVIGIDKYLPNGLRSRLRQKEKHFEKYGDFILIKGETLDKRTRKRIVKNVARVRDTVMVILDSNHTHENVLGELRWYSRFVFKGQYIVVSDTVLEDIPEQTHRPREWGHGNNPKTAVDAFLKENKRFVRDEYFNNKLLVTCNRGGYLRCVK